MYIYIHTSISICIYIHIYVYIYIYIIICKHLCTHANICMHTREYTDVYIYICTLLPSLPPKSRGSRELAAISLLLLDRHTASLEEPCFGCCALGPRGLPGVDVIVPFVAKLRALLVPDLRVLTIPLGQQLFLLAGCESLDRRQAVLAKINKCKRAKRSKQIDQSQSKEQTNCNIHMANRN